MGAAICLLTAPGTALAAECGPTPGWLDFDAPLPKVEEGLKQRHLHIVAIGSSSTQGHGARNPSVGSYPARMERELRERLPNVHIEVHNEGIGGQILRQLLDRFDEDVVAHRPDLVIVQTGPNDPAQHVSVEAFIAGLREAVQRAKAAGIDIILLDPQMYPDESEHPRYPEYVEASETIGKEFGVPVFHRYDLIEEWLARGRFTNETLFVDRLHMTDDGYRCLAHGLTETILHAVSR